MEDLASTDIVFLSNQLSHYLSSHKSDNYLEICKQYFLSAQSCHHVLGTDYWYVNGCEHNRRAFIFCVEETIRNYPPDEDITATELQQIIDLICSEFPKRIVMEASSSTTPTQIVNSVATYRLGSLKIAVYFLVLYGRWLKEMERKFEEISALKSISTTQLRLALMEVDKSLPVGYSKPPQVVLESLTTAQLSPSQSAGETKIVRFEEMCKWLFGNPVVSADVCRRPQSALPLLATASS